MPKRQSSCSLTDKSKAWKYLAGIKLSSLQPNKVTEDFYEEPEDCVPVDKSGMSESPYDMFSFIPGE